MTSPQSVRAILAFAALGMLFLALVMLRVADMPSSVRDVVMVLVGAIIALAKDAFGFFFGTSQSSQDKTDALAAMNDTRKVQIDQPADDPVPTKEAK